MLVKTLLNSVEKHIQKQLLRHAGGVPFSVRAAVGYRRFLPVRDAMNLVRDVQGGGGRAGALGHRQGAGDDQLRDTTTTVTDAGLASGALVGPTTAATDLRISHYYLAPEFCPCRRQRSRSPARVEQPVAKVATPPRLVSCRQADAYCMRRATLNHRRS